MPQPHEHEQAGEGLLHQLTDDEYFDDLHKNPVKAYDADGNELKSLFNDVVDLRAEKQGGLL